MKQSAECDTLPVRGISGLSQGGLLSQAEVFQYLAVSAIMRIKWIVRPTNKLHLQSLALASDQKKKDSHEGKGFFLRELRVRLREAPGNSDKSCCSFTSKQIKRESTDLVWTSG